jgi:hypothetical protein
MLSQLLFTVNFIVFLVSDMFGKFLLAFVVVVVAVSAPAATFRWLLLSGIFGEQTQEKKKVKSIMRQNFSIIIIH